MVTDLTTLYLVLRKKYFDIKLIYKNTILIYIQECDITGRCNLCDTFPNLDSQVNNGSKPKSIKERSRSFDIHIKDSSEYVCKSCLIRIHNLNFPLYLRFEKYQDICRFSYIIGTLEYSNTRYDEPIRLETIQFYNIKSNDPIIDKTVHQYKKFINDRIFRCKLITSNIEHLEYKISLIDEQAKIFKIYYEESFRSQCFEDCDSFRDIIQSLICQKIELEEKIVYLRNSVNKH